MLRYKVNVLEELKKRGYSTYYLRQNKIMSEGTLQKIRDNQMVGANVLELICKLLDYDIADVIEYIKE